MDSHKNDTTATPKPPQPLHLQPSAEGDELYDAMPTSRLSIRLLKLQSLDDDQPAAVSTRTVTLDETFPPIMPSATYTTPDYGIQAECDKSVPHS